MSRHHRSRLAPACMHVQARLSGTSRSCPASANTGRKARSTRRSRPFHRPGRAFYSARKPIGPENSHRDGPKSCDLDSDESTARAGPAARLSRKTSPYRKSDASTDTEAAPEKPHRNRRGIKNINGIRYLSAAGIPLCQPAIPRKFSPFRYPHECDSYVSAPEKPHLCQKVAQQKSDFCQSRRAFQRIRPVTGPEKPHL